MATSITIKYTAPTEPVKADVTPICRLFTPNNAYIDTEAYEGTVWDTNVDGWGTWQGLAAYLEKITNTPNVLILLKAAVLDGEVTFEEEDPKMVEYIKELGTALAPYGFEIDPGRTLGGNEDDTEGTEPEAPATGDDTGN